MYKNYTEDDLKIIHLFMEGKISKEELLIKLGRTWVGVSQQIKKMGYKRKKRWSLEEDELLLSLHQYESKDILLSSLKGRTWTSIKLRAQSMGLSLSGWTQRHFCVDKLKNFLSYDLENYYWIGFLLADGHWSNENRRLILSISKKDEGHIKKLIEYYGIEDIRNYKVHEYDYVTISVQHNILKEVSDKFDIKNNKTYYPPNTSVIENLDDNEIFSIFVGFVDGDGTIVNLKNRVHSNLRVKCYKSWEKFLDCIFKKVVGKDNYTNKIVYDKYIEFCITNNHILYELKCKIKKLNIPFLNRKWGNIRDNINLIGERADNRGENNNNNTLSLDIVKQIKRMINEGKSPEYIFVKLGIKKDDVYRIKYKKSWNWLQEV